MKQAHTYTVEWVKGFETSDKDRAIKRAAAVANETGCSINIYSDGVNCSYVKPNGRVVEVIKTKTVATKYHSLTKYNNANFKRLSF
jgi:hypothetical protein